MKNGEQNLPKFIWHNPTDNIWAMMVV